MNEPRRISPRKEFAIFFNTWWARVGFKTFVLHGDESLVSVICHFLMTVSRVIEIDTSSFPFERRTGEKAKEYRSNLGKIPLGTHYIGNMKKYIFIKKLKT